MVLSPLRMQQMEMIQIGTTASYDRAMMGTPICPFGKGVRSLDFVRVTIWVISTLSLKVDSQASRHEQKDDL